MSAAGPPPERWSAILDRIDARLQDALDAAAQRADRAPATLTHRGTPTWRAELDRSATRLQIMIDSEARAEVVVREADEMLATAEESLRRVRADLESLRQKLAATSGRAIG